jgi:hypothetical protein
MSGGYCGLMGVTVYGLGVVDEVLDYKKNYCWL